MVGMLNTSSARTPDSMILASTARPVYLSINAAANTAIHLSSSSLRLLTTRLTSGKAILYTETHDEENFCARNTAVFD
jgi:hypothetical protein